jgi:hypothetical protein
MVITSELLRVANRLKVVKLQGVAARRYHYPRTNNIYDRSRMPLYFHLWLVGWDNEKAGEGK